MEELRDKLMARVGELAQSSDKDRLIWNLLFMAPRIKLIVIFNLLWREFIETNATFRSASTDLEVDHALVVCELTPQ